MCCRNYDKRHFLALILALISTLKLRQKNGVFLQKTFYKIGSGFESVLYFFPDISNHDCGCTKLGRCSLQNTVSSSPFRQLKKPNKSSIQYLLGNGITLTDPEKAADEFLNKHFNDLKKCLSSPHKVKFVPESYIFKNLGCRVGSKMQLIILSIYFGLPFFPIWSFRPKNLPNFAKISILSNQYVIFVNFVTANFYFMVCGVVF